MRIKKTSQTVVLQPEIALDYSTDEVKTGFNWIDGKPLYRQVVPFTTSSTIDAWSYQAHNISNIDKIIDYKLKIYIIGTCFDVPNDIVPETNITSTNIAYYNKSNSFKEADAIAIVEYTKTTD